MFPLVKSCEVTNLQQETTNIFFPKGFITILFKQHSLFSFYTAREQKRLNIINSQTFCTEKSN